MVSLRSSSITPELDTAGVALYSDQQAIDSTTPTGRAMIQMASGVRRAGKIDHTQPRSGRPGSRPSAGEEARSPKVEDAIRRHLSAGNGILKVAALVGVGSGTVQRVKKEMVAELAEAAVTTVEGPGARVDTVMQVSEMTLAGIWWLTAAVHIIIDRPSATSGRARSADLASGAKCILCHLDPVRFKPFLVVSLRLGQCRRLRQVGRLAFRRGQLDYARHLLGSCRSAGRFIEIWSGCPAGRETCHLPRSVLPSPTRTSATYALPHGVIEIIIGSCWRTVGKDGQPATRYAEALPLRKKNAFIKGGAPNERDNSAEVKLRRTYVTDAVEVPPRFVHSLEGLRRLRQPRANRRRA